MSREQDEYKRGVEDALRVAVGELQKYSLIARNRGWVVTADIEKAVAHLRDNIRNGCKSLTLGMK